jgi:hypothetical protein
MKQNRITDPLDCSLPSSPSPASDMKWLYWVQCSCPLTGYYRYIFWEPWLSCFSSQNHESSISTLLLPLICLSSNWLFDFFQTHFLLHNYLVCPFAKTAPLGITSSLWLTHSSRSCFPLQYTTCHVSTWLTLLPLKWRQQVPLQLPSLPQDTIPTPQNDYHHNWIAAQD